MSQKVEENKSKTFKQFIGWPTASGKKVFYEYLDKMRFLFFIYGIVLIIYLVVFGLFQCPANAFLSYLFGNGFGISFSASAFEDLMMFMFLTMAVTILSIKLSTKNPEDHEFDSRIRAIMNSSNVKNDYQVFAFLKDNISLLLAYNKLIKYEIHVNDYFPDEQTFYITIRRIQIMTNMCKDRDFESTGQPIKIQPDVAINGTYGKLKFLSYIDPDTHVPVGPPIYSHTGNYPIAKEGFNVDFKYNITQDCEMGIELIYEVYSKVNDKDLMDSWSYCAVSKYTSDIQFYIYNKLPNGVNIKVDLMRVNALGKEDARIDTGKIITSGVPYNHNTERSLLPDEKLLYYMEISNPPLLTN